MKSQITRVFKNGNSQAVRIPLEFRLDVSWKAPICAASAQGLNRYIFSEVWRTST